MPPTQAPMQHKSATKPILVMIVIIVLAIIFAIYLYGKHNGGIPFITPTSSKPITPEDAQDIMNTISEQNANSNSQNLSADEQAKIMSSFSTPQKKDAKDDSLSQEQAENIFNALNN